MNTKDMRRIIVQAAHHAKHGHMPSALSLVEILKAYSEVQQKEDEIVLSKGHGCLALYAMLHLQGHVLLDEVLNFGKYNVKLGGHPDRNKLDQILSTGSLGHGLPILWVLHGERYKTKRVTYFVSWVMGKQTRVLFGNHY